MVGFDARSVGGSGAVAVELGMGFTCLENGCHAISEVFFRVGFEG